MMFKLQASENYRDIFTIVIVFKQNIVIVIVPLSPRPNVYLCLFFLTVKSDSSKGPLCTQPSNPL